MELLWRGAKSYGAQADVFTGNFESGKTSTNPVPQYQCSAGNASLSCYCSLL